MIFMRFLLAFIVLPFYTRAASDIFPCFINGTKSGDALSFAEYSEMIICCQLEEKYCNHTSFNDTLILMPETENICSKSCVAERISRLNKCLVNYKVKNATSLDQDSYQCIRNESVLYKGEVNIIEKPVLPSITSLTCNQDYNLTVQFDRGVPSTKYSESYMVTLTWETTETVLCSLSKTLCKSEERTCICNFSEAVFLKPTYNVKITVKVFRVGLSVESSMNYSLGTIIQPGPVKRMSVKDVSQHTANLQFCMSENTLRFCSVMYMQGAPLQFNLIVYRQQGIPEILNANIPAKVKLSQLCYKCMSVQLDHLTAFTKYTVAITTSGGGGKSLKTVTEFTTKQMVPEYPPLVDRFSFTRFEKMNDSTCDLTSALIVMWKPLPFAAQRGSEFSYYVEIESVNDFKFNKTLLETFLVVKDMIRTQDQHVVKIWAQNQLGRSRSYTTLQIPSKLEDRENFQQLVDSKKLDVMENTQIGSKCVSNSEDITNPSVMVELHEDKVLIYVNKTFKMDVQLAIHLCSSFTDSIINGLSICLDYPVTKNYTLLSDANEVETFEINFKELDQGRKNNITFNRPLKYYSLHYLNSTLGQLSTVNATVTLLPEGTDLDNVVTDDVYVDDGSINSFYYEYEGDNDYLVRHKRNISPQTASIKVFTSFMRKDSPWSSGMIPINCCFDATKETDSPLTVSQNYEKTDKSMTLRWDQKCSSNKANNFLASYFLVYSSTDENCQKNQKFIEKVNNTMFKPKFLKLEQKLEPSEQIKFACIKSCNINGVCNTQTVAIKYPTYFEQIVDYITTVVSGVSTFVMFFIVIICVLLCCWRRKILKEKINSKPKHSTEQKDTFVNKEWSRSDAPAPPTTNTDKIHRISNPSLDSGRGTFVCDQDTGSQNSQSVPSESQHEEKSEQSCGSFQTEESSSTLLIVCESEGKVRGRVASGIGEKKFENIGFVVRKNSKENVQSSKHEPNEKNSQEQDGLCTNSESRNQENINQSSESCKVEDGEQDEYEGNDEQEEKKDENTSEVNDYGLKVKPKRKNPCDEDPQNGTGLSRSIDGGGEEEEEGVDGGGEVEEEFVDGEGEEEEEGVDGGGEEEEEGVDGGGEVEEEGVDGGGEEEEEGVSDTSNEIKQHDNETFEDFEAEHLEVLRKQNRKDTRNPGSNLAFLACSSPSNNVFMENINTVDIAKPSHCACNIDGISHFQRNDNPEDTFNNSVHSRFQRNNNHENTFNNTIQSRFQRHNNHEGTINNQSRFQRHNNNEGTFNNSVQSRFQRNDNHENTFNNFIQSCFQRNDNHEDSFNNSVCRASDIQRLLSSSESESEGECEKALLHLDQRNSSSQFMH